MLVLLANYGLRQKRLKREKSVINQLSLYVLAQLSIIRRHVSLVVERRSSSTIEKGKRLRTAMYYTAESA